MNTDLTFITNEPEANLLNRFKVLIKDARFFDSLVGYFYTSGFYKLYPVLGKTEKIRILIGIGTGRETLENIKAAEEQLPLTFSHAEAKEEFSTLIASELEESEDAESIEEGVQRFIDWIKSGKLEVRAYPTANIHAKLYIITFKEGDRDIGRVITGSSNFSQKGLVDNLEFNVELKMAADYRFAQDKFNQLWKDAVDVSDTAYFVYANGLKGDRVFDARIEFEVQIIPHKGNISWVEPTIFTMKKCLDSDSIPESDPDCEPCMYRKLIRVKE